MRNFPIQIEFDSTPHFELLGPEPNMAVVPFFDFFNHSSSVSTKIELTDGVVYLTTSGSYNIGDQVNIWSFRVNYETNNDMLLKY